MAPPRAAVVLACVVFCLSCTVYVCCHSVTSYTKEVLLHIGSSTPPDIFPTLLTRSTDVLDILVRGTAFFASIVRWTRRQRGRRGGCLARLRRRGSRPPLPGIFLGNVNSLPNKMDELRLLISRNNDFHSTAVFALVETHLTPAVPDEAVQPEGFSMLRTDRDFEAVGKLRRGGLLFSNL